MQYRSCDSKKPTIQYATKFFDYSLDAIGVRKRTVELLERVHNVVVVRDLIPIKTVNLAAVKQLGQVQLRELLQCMANIGIPVENYKPDLSKIPLPPHEVEHTFGVPTCERLRFYSPRKPCGVSTH